MDNAYEAIFLVSSSIAALLEQEGIRPDIVAGHGLGEYSAICAAGGLSLPDGLYFLSKYAQFYQELLNSFEARAIKAHHIASTKVEKICNAVATQQDLVSVAERLSDNASIVTGILDAVNQAEQEVLKLNGKTDEVPLQTGLHSSLMNPVVEQLAVYLEKVDFNDLQMPLIASFNGKTITKGEMVKEYIMQKINHMVRWDKVVEQLAKWDLIIKVGPGSKLSVELENRYPDKKIIAINKPVDIDVLKEMLAQKSTEE